RSACRLRRDPERVVELAPPGYSPGKPARPSTSNARLPTRLAPADRPGLSPDGSGPGPVVRAAGDPPEPDLLLLDRGFGGGRVVLLAGGGRAGAAAPGGRVLLPAVVVEHARRHGGAGFGQGQPHRRDRQRAARPCLRRAYLRRRRPQRPVPPARRLLGRH